jgi:epoxyqueuosine reductase QueG
MIKQILKKYLQPSSDFIYGFANLEGLLEAEFKDYTFGISIGKKLDDSIVDLVENGPTMEYYQHYHNVNTELDRIASQICKELNENGIRSRNIIPTIKTTGDELKDLKYKISHKMVATRAGLGWIGKTDLLISKKFGPRLRLVSVLLEKPLDIESREINQSHCGTCDICVEKCPAKAANGKLWNIETYRDEFFDAYKCRAMCAELAKKHLNQDIRICGICVSVCPIGNKGRKKLSVKIA